MKKIIVIAVTLLWSISPLFAANDVLVIGGGPAGLATAIEAADSGAQVTVVEKRKSYSRSQSVFLFDASIKLLEKWKVNIPESKKQEIYEGIDVKVKFKGEELDSDLNTIGDYFKEQPTAKHIHIIVERSSPATTGKCLPTFYLSNKK